MVGPKQRRSTAAAAAADFAVGSTNSLLAATDAADAVAALWAVE